MYAGPGGRRHHSVLISPLCDAPRDAVYDRNIQSEMTDAALDIPEYYYAPIHAYADGNLCWDSAMEVTLTFLSFLCVCLPTPVLSNATIITEKWPCDHHHHRDFCWASKLARYMKTSKHVKE